MKKKFLKKIVAVVAALSMTTTVMAAGSIVGAIDMPKVAASQGKVTLQKVTAGMYEPEVQAVVDKLNAAKAGATVKEAFGGELPNVINLYNADGLQMEAIDMSAYKFLSPVMDLQITDVEPTAENPVKVTFVVNNMTENMEVDVLHLCAEHEWEVLEGEKISSNQVAADFHSASPVALIYKMKSSELGTDAISPQTGEREMWPVALAAVVFMGTGIFAVVKRRKTV